MITGVKYMGLALPLSSSTVSLFDSTVAFQHGGQMKACNFKRLLLDLVCSNDGTLTWYKSEDHGTNWYQLGTQAVTGASNTSTIVDFLIEEYSDWKLTFTVGGTTETVFVPSMTLTDQRVKAN